MKKEDFEVGMTVYLHRIRNLRWKGNPEANIIETKVVSIGRKYLTVEYWGKMRFDMTNNFREVSGYSPEFVLYLRKEDIFKAIERRKKIETIENALRIGNNVLPKLTADEMDVIIGIFKKHGYQEDEHGQRADSH